MMMNKRIQLIGQTVVANSSSPRSCGEHKRPRCSRCKVGPRNLIRGHHRGSYAAPLDSTDIVSY